MNSNQLYSQKDKLRVFVASRTVFAGPSALIRKNKKINDLVLKHQQSLKEIIREYGTVRVADIVKSLLESRVCESETIARKRLPQLYRTTEVQEIRHTRSDDHATKPEAEALGKVTSGRDDKGEKDVGRGNNNVEDGWSYL